MLTFDTSEIQDLVSALEHDGRLLQNLIQDDVFLERLTEQQKALILAKTGTVTHL
jgi:hypothetical protein